MELCERCGREARGFNRTVWKDTQRVWCTDCAFAAFFAWKASDCVKTDEEVAQIAAVDRALDAFVRACRA